MNTFHADMIALCVTPGILISACGVVATAPYNRLGVIVARVRAYQQQKIDLLVKPQPHDMADTHSLLAMLDAQIAAVTAKAKMIQNGLYCLLAAIVAFLLCSVCAGLAIVYDRLGVVALVSGFSGVCLFIAGLGWAVREVTCALSPLEQETAYLKALSSQFLLKTRERIQLKIAE